MMMKAVRIYTYGEPDVLVYEDVCRPEVRPDEVLIHVHAAGVNPVDLKVREGHLKDRWGHHLPLILGWDASGVVEDVGSGVFNFRPGDQVFAHLDTMRDGTYAEYVAAPASALARKPKSLSYVEAAAVPLASLTAWQTLFETGGLSLRQRVLIHGAGGSVGGFAVQLAKQKGARVIALANTAEMQFVSSLGADEVLDYQARPFEDVVKKVDLVLDVIGGAVQERSLRVVKRGGTVVSTVQIVVAEKAADFGVQIKPFLVKPNGDQLSEIGGQVAAGKLKFKVGTVLPLSEAREAHRLVQSGQPKGKVVLKVMS
jgi:NADPH:quinone reductase-like Zn-dependent oxidoreductase